MKIICVGKNYSEHVKELQGEIPEMPVLFSKPESAICSSSHICIPEFTQELHYEAELVFKISKPGKNIPKKEAAFFYNEVALGIDFTARDIQRYLKKNGLPWERAKAFDNSALISDFVPLQSLLDKEDISFSLEKNEKIVQQGNSKDMLFDVDTLISDISQFFSLEKGDLVFTGTPAGVGKVSLGDSYKGFIENREMLSFTVID